MREKKSKKANREARGIKDTNETLDGSRVDWSAEERFYNRSVEIRRHVLVWLDKSVGKQWKELMKIGEECANDKKPLPFSSMTAYRWINQFSASNAPFVIAKDWNSGDWKVGRRRRLTAQDFIKWGVVPPKRFNN